MRERVLISSGSPFEGSVGFSRATRVGNVIAVAGTAPLSDNGETVCVGDLYGQTRRCCEIMSKAIEEAGGSLADVVRTRVMLTDVTRWREAARAHGEFFGAIRPACTFVEVKGFIDRDWLVETEADCVVGEIPAPA